MDPELADLVPIFVEEARDRLERLATLAPRVGDDAPTESGESAMVEVKRELHTLKGAGRMLQLTPFADICHGAEELLQSDRDDKVPLLLRASDALSAMVDAVEAGEEPGDGADLIPLLFGAAAEEEEEDAAAPVPEPTEPEPVPPDPEPASALAEAPAPVAPEPGEGGDVRISAGAVGGPVATTVHATEVEGDESAAPRRGKGALHTGDIRVDATAIDRVADRATQIRIMSLASHRLSERVYDLARLAEEGVHEDKPTQVLAVLATMLRRVAVDLEGGQQRMSRAADEQLEGVLTLQVQPLKPFLLSLARHIRELAQSLGRQVEVEIEGADTRLDRRIVRELDESLIHLARNAVDHGLESPEERRRAGKNPTGKIRIQAGGQGSRVRLVLEDDGAGIDIHRIVERAVRVGLVERNAARSMTPEQIYRLLFAPGFSTRTEVSQLSGRGVGLDVVAAAVIRVGGEVFLSSEPGRGTRVTLEVPLARRGEEVLLLRLGQMRLAVPKAAIRRAVPLDKDKVLERDGRSLVEHEGRLVAFVPLSSVYGEPAAASQHLVLGDISGQPFALVVDEVEGEEEVLVRPVPRSVATDRYLDGVALLASGEPVGVLSPAALARRELLNARPRRRERAAAQTVRVLLVDDSLVTREMERRLLEDAGFDVTAAGDAEEGLSALAEETFDCLVTDIEMPGMDGFELTEHLRGMEHFGELPIVVVSTRDRPEDRLRGLKAGADAYLTKQSLDAGELVDIVRRLSGS